MKIPVSWLADFVDLDCDLKTFTDVMTMSGSKVEGTELKGSELSGIVAGKIVSIEKHPGADKLLITKVDTGEAEPLQIVTGAENVFEGACVPIALHGATLADGKKIERGMLRGEVSDGMLCSIQELGYTTDDYPEACADGIYIFKEPVLPGADVVPILMLRENVVEFEITSNRPDCFSVLGISREAAAAFGKELKKPDIKVNETAEGNACDFIEVEIQNSELCPRYCARIVKNVKIAPSPLWMRHRLTAAGVRPVNNIVDITNYVMLELGQPMHAFDLDCVSGGKIIVRNAVQGEVMTTLDGTARVLDESMLVIADTDRAVGVAGVMGGENSKITGGAGAVLFESAAFNGVSVRQTAKKLGLRTESSAKFEKGLDPNLPIIAINRAAQLVEELGAGEVTQGVVDVYPNPRIEWQINYSYDKINSLLGTEITPGEIDKILNSLELSAHNGVAEIPTFRPDLTEEADLTEEVARFYGYDNIQATLASGTPTLGGRGKSQILTDRARAIMLANGFNEALSFAFESPKVFDKLNISAESGLRSAAVIKNPLGEDYSIMRTTTLNAMLTSLSLNYNQRNPEARLFEFARIYLPKTVPLTSLPDEPGVLTAGLYGGDADFYDIKGVAEALTKGLGLEADGSQVVYAPDMPEGISAPISDVSLPFLHPGRRAYVIAGDTMLGYLGEVHPVVLERYEIGVRAYVAVLFTDAVFSLASAKTVYAPLPKFPGIRRDIAVIVDDAVMAGHIKNSIISSCGETLKSVDIFDVYKGKNVREGGKSLAFSLYFRADRTLTDSEVARDMDNVLNALKEQFGAELRG